MANKKQTPKVPADSVLVTAATTIGKVAGRIAAVVSRNPKTKAQPDPQPGKQAVRKLAKVMPKKSAVSTARKAVAKSAGGAKKKAAGRKAK